MISHWTRCIGLFSVALSASACVMAPTLGEDAQTLPLGGFAAGVHAGVSTQPALVQKDRSALDKQRAKDAPNGNLTTFDDSENFIIYDGEPPDLGLVLRGRLRVGVGLGFELFLDADLIFPLFGGGGGVRWQAVDTRFFDATLVAGVLAGALEDISGDDPGEDNPKSKFSAWSRYARVILTAKPNDRIRFSLAPTLSYTTLETRSVAYYPNYAQPGEPPQDTDEDTPSYVDLGAVERSSWSYGGAAAVHIPIHGEPHTLLGVELGVMYTPAAHGLPALWSFQPALTGTFSTL